MTRSQISSVAVIGRVPISRRNRRLVHRDLAATGVRANREARQPRVADGGFDESRFRRAGQCPDLSVGAKSASRAHRATDTMIDLACPAYEPPETACYKVSLATLEGFEPSIFTLKG
jgi:hypothetical protein